MDRDKDGTTILTEEFTRFTDGALEQFLTNIANKGPFWTLFVLAVLLIITAISALLVLGLIYKLTGFAIKWLLCRLDRLYTSFAMFYFLLFLLLLPILLYPVFDPPPLPLYRDGSNFRALLIGNLIFQGFRLFVIVVAVGMGGLYLAAVALCANAAAVASSNLIRWLIAKLDFREPTPLAPISPRGVTQQANPLQNYQRIGIVLAGGGAKGAYQAGAMKAIYDFINGCGAHHKVKMIAGTSIGTWNALFWLANLVADGNTSQSPLREWWQSISLKKILRPVAYVPFRHNFLFSPKPWKENFKATFEQQAVASELSKLFLNPDLHFYFTSTNIGKGRLECTTNNPKAKEISERLGVLNVIDFYHATEINHIENAVFTSMALPLIFQATERKSGAGTTKGQSSFYEDGGVIDNLPISIGTELEGCDLIFVLPLNASFEKDVDQASLIKRLFRILDIRQGALEQNSLASVELHNQVVDLQNKIYEHEKFLYCLKTHTATIDPNTRLQIDNFTDQLRPSTFRQRKRTDIFAVCPAPAAEKALPPPSWFKRLWGHFSKPEFDSNRKLSVGTIEFWKHAEASKAFDVMEKAVAGELNRFPENLNKLLTVEEGKGAVSTKPLL